MVTVVIVTGCARAVTSQYDVIFTLQNYVHAARMSHPIPAVEHRRCADGMAHTQGC